MHRLLVWNWPHLIEKNLDCSYFIPCFKLANCYYSMFCVDIVNLNCRKENYFMANYKKWTDTELSYIQDNHSLLCDESLASSLSKITGSPISTAMVRRQRRKLSLKKSRGRPKKTPNVVSPLQSGEVVS